jgi:hypothetical protein
VPFLGQHLTALASTALLLSVLSHCRGIASQPALVQLAIVHSHGLAVEAMCKALTLVDAYAYASSHFSSAHSVTAFWLLGCISRAGAATHLRSHGALTATTSTRFTASHSCVKGTTKLLSMRAETDLLP